MRVIPETAGMLRDAERGIRKKFVTVMWSGLGTSCPEKLWLCQPWKCSGPEWMGLRATWSGRRC